VHATVIAMELETKPQTTQLDAPSTAATSDAGSSTASFTSQGAIPPVSTAAPQAASPSASDRAFGGIGGFFEHVGQDLEVAGGEAVGVAELAGLRYPVKTYEAQVDSGLYRGSRVDAAQMASLQQQGIRGIVNLCLENNEDAATAAQLGMAALHVPILDNSAPTVAQMMEFVAFAKANPPTYVHCEAGEGRTGTAVACYRIAVDGWTAEQAIDEAKSFGLSLIDQIDFIEKFAQATGGVATPATAPNTDPVQTSNTTKPLPDGPSQH
jgi:protein tyrosine phosphatase (PTP) superfamily phosphohydrolase (DUF442 family)